ncbi:MAG: hypothetical protein JO352_00960 [Chloroflexi bacterium]|nr:hypothetical protein [Chloroflexota bacterium]MBV9597630.1 hypothetical protein [Chloroflexota bacterium]
MQISSRRSRLRPFHSLVLLAAVLATTASSIVSNASAAPYKDPTGDDVVAHVASTPAPVAFLKAPPTT